ncbi:hypothetical protein [Microterricola viridarii]|uniref:Uncharacterized protein n=1 Tax=Microterricola viridarii TaxID=412690 RepID=A0A0Y0N9G2_9MICO|nr:hypothetical protein [Microterricola viridarii]AMB57651.1 hypothetical protein AWU67_00885 [Microterricola viridarii]
MGADENAAELGAPEQDLDESTRIVRRGYEIPDLDEETRIVVRPVARQLDLVDEFDEFDEFDESTRIVNRAVVPDDESTVLDHRESTPSGADVADATNPGRRRAARTAAAPVAIPAPQPTSTGAAPALPPLLVGTSLASGQTESYPPRVLPEPPVPQHLQIDVEPRERPAAAPRGATARRVALTVLVTLVGVAALGVAVVALVLLLNTL